MIAHATFHTGVVANSTCDGGHRVGVQNHFERLCRPVHGDITQVVRDVLMSRTRFLAGGGDAIEGT